MHASSISGREGKSRRFTTTMAASKRTAVSTGSPIEILNI